MSVLRRDRRGRVRARGDGDRAGWDRFWAACYYGRSAILLVAWVAAFAIVRGVRDIVFSFRVRELQHG